MSKTRDADRPAVRILYDVFSSYANAGSVFCGVCYTPEEVKLITETPLSDLDTKTARTLLWETADHWESGDVYRHYLPRLLELLGPPSFLDDLYPLHLFETLVGVGFRRWPEAEREAVIAYLEGIGSAVADAHAFSDASRLDWAKGITALKQPTLALHSASETQ